MATAAAAPAAATTTTTTTTTATTTTNAASEMEYRFLGNSGLKVSVISLGNWLNNQKDTPETQALMTEAVKTAWSLGINYFDTAEGYGFGVGQRQLGVALKELGLPREQFVISDKVWFSEFPGPQAHPNAIGTSYKRVKEFIKQSIQRLQVEYIDIVFSHRRDNDAPIEEICRAFNDVIEDGLAFYWGTSMWTAAEIVQAIEVCERLNLHKPIVEQPQYNMLVRERFEVEYGIIFDKYKYGSTVWSPLMGGILSGKYNKELPPASRFTDADIAPRLRVDFERMFTTEKEKTLATFAKLDEIAKELGGNQAQLAMAWVINNRNVSTAITGCSRPEQLVDSVGALKLYRKFTPAIEKRIEEALGNLPFTGMNFKLFQPFEPRRPKVVLY